MTKHITDWEEWEDWLWGPESKTVVEETPTYQDRWYTHWEQIIKRGDKFYRLKWASGSTEYQDISFENSDATVTEVKPVEKIVVVYEDIK